MGTSVFVSKKRTTSCDVYIFQIKQCCSIETILPSSRSEASMCCVKTVALYNHVDVSQISFDNEVCRVKWRRFYNKIVNYQSIFKDIRFKFGTLI